MRISRMVMVLVMVGLVYTPAAQAHWCSNIYRTYARIVVKPERQTVSVAAGEIVSLKVKVRNNFPYNLKWIKLRAKHPDFNIGVSPNEVEAEDNSIFPGEEVTFVLSIERRSDSTSDVGVSELGLKVAVFRDGIASTFRSIGEKDYFFKILDPEPNEFWDLATQRPEPTAEEIRAATVPQTTSLNWARLADLSEDYPYNGGVCEDCEFDGANMLLLAISQINTSDDGTAEHQRLRALQAMAIRLRFNSFNNPTRVTAIDQLLDTMKVDDGVIRGLAAFVIGYGGETSATAELQSMADTDPSLNASCMAKAGLYIMSQGDYAADLSACLQADVVYHTHMVCEAALAIMGDDASMRDSLLGQSNVHASEISESYQQLLAAYLIQLVVVARRGGPKGDQPVSFLDEIEGEVLTEIPEQTFPPEDSAEDSGCGCGRSGGSMGGLLLFGWMLFWWARRWRVLDGN